MPYSFGKPALNCCGGSLSTLGNMKRPVAASAAADAAENAPQASPIHARRVRSGDVSSGSRPRAAGLRPPRGAALRRRAAGGRGVGRLAGEIRHRRRGRPRRRGAVSRHAGAGARAAPVAAAARRRRRVAAGIWRVCGVAAGLAPVGGALGSLRLRFVSHSRYPITFSASSAACRTFMLRSCWLSVSTGGLQRLVLQRRGRAQAADHDVGDRILILVLAHVALDRLLDVARDRASAAARRRLPAAVARQRDGGVPAHVGRAVFERRAQRVDLRVARQRAEAYTTILRMPASRRLRRAAAASARPPGRPRASAQMVLMPRSSPSGDRRARAGRALGDRVGRQRRVEPADRQRQIPADPRIAVFGDPRTP